MNDISGLKNFSHPDKNLSHRHLLSGDDSIQSIVRSDLLSLSLKQAMLRKPVSITHNIP
jgi:hypothetical protein